MSSQPAWTRTRVLTTGQVRALRCCPCVHCVMFSPAIYVPACMLGDSVRAGRQHGAGEEALHPWKAVLPPLLLSQQLTLNQPPQPRSSSCKVVLAQPASR
eukprot:976302-Rhodomonas_salina.3